MSAPKRKVSITIAIPSSTTVDVPHLREKTFRLGCIGRTAAIFRVSRILIYRDLHAFSDGRLMERILSYMATPQYIRKKLFKITPELKYAGILSPLRTPNHPLQRFSAALKLNEIRQGVIVESSNEISLVDIGVERLVSIPKYHKPNTVVNVKILEVNKTIKAEPVTPSQIDIYWGFDVKLSKITLAEYLRTAHYDLKIATSKYGSSLSEVHGRILEKWMKAENIFLAFGSPTEGLREILSRESSKVEQLFDFNINTVRNQGTETVRTEEAVLSTMSLLNFLFV